MAMMMAAAEEAAAAVAVVAAATTALSRSVTIVLVFWTFVCLVSTSVLRVTLGVTVLGFVFRNEESLYLFRLQAGSFLGKQSTWNIYSPFVRLSVFFENTDGALLFVSFLAGHDDDRG